MVALSLLRSLQFETIASQSTSPAATCKAMSVKETCLICFEDNPIARMFSVGTCHHNYCLSCIKHHVEVQFQSGNCCTFPRCTALMSKQEAKTSFASEGGRKCMKCHQYFCINCRVPWHYDMSCCDYQSSENYFRSEDQLALEAKLDHMRDLQEVQLARTSTVIFS